MHNLITFLQIVEIYRVTAQWLALVWIVVDWCLWSVLKSEDQ